MKVLIADDSIIFLKLLENLLKSFGYNDILTAQNGEAAVLAYKTNNVDLILMDINMPICDGYEAVRQIRKHASSSRIIADWIPIILMSGNMEKENIVEGLNVGADDYIAKPISRKILKVKILAMERIAKMRKELLHVTTQLKDTQNQVIQNSRLSATNNLISGLAHEINNPISFVNSNLFTLNDYIQDFKTLLTEYKSNLEKTEDKALLKKMNALEEELDISFIIEDSESIIKDSQEGINRVTSLINKLRIFFEKDNQINDCVSINSCLENILNSFSYNFNNQNIVKNYTDVPIITCNEFKITQVFLSIIENASQAMKEDGTLKISTNHNDKDIFISIEDNGTGIPQEQLKHIFDPFFKNDSNSHKLGLGLYYCLNTVKEYGGNIQVTSKENSGTTVTITLPINTLDNISNLNNKKIS